MAGHQASFKPQLQRRIRTPRRAQEQQTAAHRPPSSVNSPPGQTGQGRACAAQARLSEADEGLGRPQNETEAEFQQGWIPVDKLSADSRSRSRCCHEWVVTAKSLSQTRSPRRLSYSFLFPILRRPPICHANEVAKSCSRATGRRGTTQQQQTPDARGKASNNNRNTVIGSVQATADNQRPQTQARSFFPAANTGASHPPLIPRAAAPPGNPPPPDLSSAFRRHPIGPSNRSASQMLI